jgi:hypothetical protein
LDSSNNSAASDKGHTGALYLKNSDPAAEAGMALFTTTSVLYDGVLWSGEFQGLIIHELVPVFGMSGLMYNSQISGDFTAGSEYTSSGNPPPTHLPDLAFGFPRHALGGNTQGDQSAMLPAMPHSAAHRPPSWTKTRDHHPSHLGGL